MPIRVMASPAIRGEKTGELTGGLIRSPELQAQIDGYYEEWRKSRAKWKTPRGRCGSKRLQILNQLPFLDVHKVRAEYMSYVTISPHARIK